MNLRSRVSARWSLASRASMYCGAGFLRRFDGLSYVHSAGKLVKWEDQLDNETAGKVFLFLSPYCIFPRFSPFFSSILGERREGGGGL